MFFTGMTKSLKSSVPNVAAAPAPKAPVVLAKVAAKPAIKAKVVLKKK